MKLEVGFPVPKNKTMGPHKDYYPNPKDLPNLHRGGGWYQCTACRALTAWMLYIDGMDLHVCSTECIEAAVNMVNAAISARAEEEKAKQSK